MNWILGWSLRHPTDLNTLCCTVRDQSEENHQCHCSRSASSQYRIAVQENASLATICFPALYLEFLVDHNHILLWLASRIHYTRSESKPLPPHYPLASKCSPNQNERHKDGIKWARKEGKKDGRNFEVERKEAIVAHVGIDCPRLHRPDPWRGRIDSPWLQSGRWIDLGSPTPGLRQTRPSHASAYSTCQSVLF